MLIAKSIAEIREALEPYRRSGKRVGFVPTMGALHAGHLSLCDVTAARSDVVVASVFINPTQFNNPNDLAAYPYDLDRDARMLESEGVSLLFAPTKELMYGADFESWVELQKLPTLWEGAHRPGHFRGVSTVVSMLFNIVQPQVAAFGEKDFQQLRIIEQMAHDLHLPIEILRAPIIREPDGLAMSSRNVRLSSSGRKKAIAISAGLFAARDAFQHGESTAASLTELAGQGVRALDGVEVEYIAVVEEQNLLEQSEARAGHRILCAVVVDGVRLIDNLRL
jgi:pantoate--beta-alanine ligase